MGARALFDAEGVEAVFSGARETAGRAGVDLRLPRPEPDGRRAPGQPACSWPFESSYVTHDGRVQPCCMVMGSDRATVGALGERRFAGL